MAAGLEREGGGAESLGIGEKPIAGCTACGDGSESGRCVIEDDRVNEFAKKLASCDGLVIGAPVHFAGMAGAMKCFLDRAFYTPQGRAAAGGKPLACVTSCRRAGSTATLDGLNKYGPICGMPLVPSQYWPMVHGNTPAEVKQDLEGLQIMRTLARNLLWMMRCFELGRTQGLAYPELEQPRARTNFIRYF